MATVPQTPPVPVASPGTATKSFLTTSEYVEATTAIGRFIETVRWTLRVLISAADRFYWDNGFSKAASLAYTTLFALVPVSVLAFGLLGSFALSNEHLPQVRDFIFRQFVPQLNVVDDVLAYLTNFSETLASLNMLAVVFIVVTAILLINSIEFALNEIWQVFEPRSISHRVGIFCAIIVLAPILAVSAYYFARFRIETFLLDVGAPSYFNLAYAFVLPFLIDFFAFLALYYLVPKAPVRLNSAFFGGALAAILFGMAKSAFAIYIQTFSSYDKIYGALASIPVFLFWLYLAWTIVLFGAELSYQYQYLPKRGRLWKRSVMTAGDGRIVLAMQSLVEIARAFEEGRRLPNDLELAERLGCSSVILKPALDALDSKGIISRGESRTMPLTLMRSPSVITVEEIREALFSSRIALHHPGEMARLFGYFRDDEDLSKVSLADIIVRSSPQ